MAKDEERLDKVKKTVREASRLSEDLLSLEHEEEIRKRAGVIERKIGQVYEEIERIGDPITQADALHALESFVEKGSEAERDVMKRKGFNPFKKFRT